jgi:uncharacterized delta-60 repeat protein
MKKLFSSAAVIAFALVACQTAPTPVIEKPEYQLLGKLEVAFGESPLGVSRAKFTPARLDSQAVVNESQLTFTADTFTTAVRTADNNRFLNAKFTIRNNTGATLQNLLLVAAHRTGNSGGSAIKNINNFNNVNLNNYARAIKPSHAMSGNGTVSVVANQEHLALLSEYDVDRMTTDAGTALGVGEYLLPYGYLASKIGASTDLDNYYNIPNNASTDTGEVTLAMRVDGTNEPPAANAYRFTFTAMVFGQATLPLDKSPMAESLEELGTGSAQTRASARNAALGTFLNQTYYLHNSSSLSNSSTLQNNVCQGRTAGTVASPVNLSNVLPNNTVGEFDDCFGAAGKRILNGTGFTDVAKFSDGRLALVGMTEDNTQTPIHTWAMLKPNGAAANRTALYQAGTTNLRSQGVTVDNLGRMIYVAENRNLGSRNTFWVHRRIASVTTSMNSQLGDSSFGTNGTSVITVGGASNFTYPTAIGVQSDHKIIVAGMTEAGLSRQIFLRRINTTDGSVDSSFNFAGGNLPATANTSWNNLFSMTIDSADKIIVTGGTRESNTDDYDLFVARFNADGSADTTFDTDGYKIEALNASTEDIGQTVVVDGNKILVAGYVEQTVSSQVRKALAIVRFTSTGALDTTFDTDGKLIISEALTDIEAKKILLQPNGRIVVVSYPFFLANSNTNNDRTVRVERFTTAGARDTSFNLAGTIPGRNEYDVSGVRETPESAVIIGSNTNAKLIVVGQTNQNGATFNNFAISINLGDIVSTGGSSN